MRSGLARPRVSIVFVNLLSERYVYRSVESLVAHAGTEPFELIIVDNGSEEPEVLDRACELPPDGQRAMVVRNPTNVGFSRACNQAIARTTGEFVTLINPDTIAVTDLLSPLVAAMDRDPRVGVVGPKVLDWDANTVQLSCRRFPTLATALCNRYSLITRLLPRNPSTRSYLMLDWDHGATRQVDWISACCMMLRRSMLEGVGTFDPAYFMYCEDLDLCLRASREGWKVVYVPEAVIRHRIGASSTRVPRKLCIERSKSIWRFYRKHYPSHPLLLPVLWAGLAGHTLLRMVLPDRYAVLGPAAEARAAPRERTAPGPASSAP